MFRRTVLGLLAISAFVWGSDAFAGNVELYTYYPTPDGEYTTLNSTSSSTFATTLGQNVGIGTKVLTTLGTANTHSDLTITGSIAQDAWTPVAAGNFLHSWVNCTTWAGFNTAAYFRDKNGIVYLKGFVSTGAVATGTTAGVPDGAIFQLPVGYRPEKRQVRAVMTYNGAVHLLGRCDIDANGYVIAMAGGPNFYSLDGISFKASGY